MATAAVPSVSDVALPGELEELFREHHRLIYRTAYSVPADRKSVV